MLLDIPSPETGQFQGQALNLSQRGIQVSCNAAPVACLIKQSGHPAECQINFQIPNSDRQIRARYRLVVNRRVAQDHHLLGFNLLEFFGESEAWLSDYLAELQRKY